mmetsp:Transcript_19843/g.37865  ORF Transcript_19843/g.37865 Transcript_19843/m.37865 type:complete len:101 (+) Transcript_19843:1-303(+)
MLSTSAAPPSPAAPPAFPTLPPKSSQKDDLGEMMILIVIVAFVVLFLVVGIVHMYWFDFANWKLRGAEQKEIVQTKDYIPSVPNNQISGLSKKIQDDVRA